MISLTLWAKITMISLTLWAKITIISHTTFSNFDFSQELEIPNNFPRNVIIRNILPVTLKPRNYLHNFKKNTYVQLTKYEIIFPTG